MLKVKKTIEVWKCLRCGHEWQSKKKKSKLVPIQCPKCKSPRWQIPKPKKVKK